MTRLPIIDTHVHFWNRRTPDPGMAWVWLNDDADHPVLGNIDGMKMLSYQVDNYYAEVRFADVEGFVHVQAAIGSDDPVKETLWLARMRENSPLPFSIVGDAPLGDDNASEVLARQCEASPYFVGLRDFGLEPALAAGEVSARREASLADMAERNLVLDMDCEWQNMPAARAMAERHPKLQIVLEHIGFPRSRDDGYYSNWLSGIQELAKAPNVTCKVSGLAMTDPLFTPQSLARWIDACLDTFGPDRCIIGSNWPVDRLYSSYDPIMEIYRAHVARFDEADQRKILSENARRLYRVG